MKIILEKVANGFVATFPADDSFIAGSTFVYESGTRGLMELLSDVANCLARDVDASRYSAARVYVMAAPGDKYEGPLTEIVKESTDLMQVLLERADNLKLNNEEKAQQEEV